MKNRKSSANRSSKLAIVLLMCILGIAATALPANAQGTSDLCERTASDNSVSAEFPCDWTITGNTFANFGAKSNQNESVSQSIMTVDPNVTPEAVVQYLYPKYFPGIQNIHIIESHYLYTGEGFQGAQFHYQYVQAEQGILMEGIANVYILGPTYTPDNSYALSILWVQAMEAPLEIFHSKSPFYLMLLNTFRENNDCKVRQILGGPSICN